MRSEILGGRYRLLERIGEGGMAFVYVALDEKLGRKVAIKVLHEHMERNQDIRKRFQLEAQAISGLDHPNIVKIYDFSGAQSERLWIVTEVIHGKNLAQFVQQLTSGWLHPIVAAAIVREICKALDKAHSQGIVHRDIKPENIMLTNDGKLKLMDFGIAKDLGKSSMTLTGTFMGSPSYMSTEQIRGRDVDLRSDLYSLSVLFYEIVTGRLPFTGQSTHEVILKIMDGGFTHPRFIVPTLPDTLNHLIVMGMSKDPAGRHQSANALGRELDQFLQAMNFDESHIELERYVLDRASYEEKLSRQRQELLQSGTLAARLQHASQAQTDLLRPRPSAPETQANSTSKYNANSARRVTNSRIAEPPHRLPPPKIPGAAAHQASSAIPPQNNGHLNKSEGTSTKRLATVANLARQPTPIPAPTAKQFSVYQAQTAEAVVQKAALVPPTPKFNQVKRRPVMAIARRLAKRSYNNPVRRMQRRAIARPSLLSQIFSVIIVGLIGVLCVYGFWELQTKLTDPATKVLENKTRRTQRLIRPSNDTRILQRPTYLKTDNATSKSASASRRDLEIKNKSQNLRSRPPTPSRAKNIVSDVMIEKTVDPNLQAESVEIKRSIKPGKKIMSASSATANIRSETPAAAMKGKLGGGKVTFSSQPAGEIYVDGKRLGTTIDSTTSSGWFDLSDGEHTYELRRQGYESVFGKFTLSGGEHRQIAPVQLRPLTAQIAPQSYSLTLRVSPIPVQVNLRNLANGSTQSFTLKSPTRVVELPPGRYHVRTEFRGVIKEREINLTGSIQNLTFNAEFKPDD